MAFKSTRNQNQSLMRDLRIVFVLALSLLPAAAASATPPSSPSASKSSSSSELFQSLRLVGVIQSKALIAMTGMAIYTLQDFSLPAILTALKIMLIVVLVFITSPTATHAILDAGVRAGLGPWSAPEKKAKR